MATAVGLPMPGRRSSWKMHVAQCKRMAQGAIEIAEYTPGERARVEYLEVATAFLRLAGDVAEQHAGSPLGSRRSELVTDNRRGKH